MFVNDDPSSIKKTADDFAKSLSTATKLTIEAQVTDSYGEAHRALCNGEAHLATLDAFSYLAVSQAGCGSLLYTTVIDGEKSTRGQMLTIAGKEIYSVVGFKGFRFCRSGPLSIPGWVVPSLMLRANGLNPMTDLYSVTDTKTDEAVIKSLLSYQCDVGATVVGAEVGIPNSNRIKIIATLPPVPTVAYALSLKLDTATQALLLDKLRNHEDKLKDLIEADELLKGDENEYAELRQLVIDAKLNLVSMGQ